VTFGTAELDRLITLLKDADISAAPDQIVAAHDLLLRLEFSNAAPATLAHWRPLLAPVFCRSPQEQERFYRLFDAWCANTAATTAADRKQVEPIPPLPQRTHLRPRHVLGAIGIVAVIALGVLLRPPQPQPIDREQEKQSPSGPREADRPSTQPVEPSPQPADDTSLDFVFPRPPERIEARLHAPGAAAVNARQMRWALVPLPLLLIIGALFWVLMRRRLMLTRGADTTPPEPHRFPVRGSQDGLFSGHRLRPTIDRLRAAARVPMREIDARRTVDVTLRRAGLFTPIYRTRREIPDYVVMIDRRRPADHVSSFARALIERLRAEALAVSVYYFSGDPRRCQAEDRPMMSQTLDDIEALHGHARLIVVSDGSGFFNPFTGQLERWTTQLERWRSRTLMTATPIRQWGYAEFLFALNGYAVTTLDAVGIDAAARWMLATTSAEDDAVDVAPLLREAASARTLPKIIERHFDEWSSREPPRHVDVAAAIDAVKRYLDPQGFLVLCALAMYPQVTWPLTLFIDSRLAPSEEAEDARERRVLSLARLPWLRDAHMPDYLRLALIRSLPPDIERHIRALYQALFESADQAGAHAIELTVDRPPSGEVRRRLARLFSSPPAAGPYTDRIFAQVLLFGKPGRLDIELPRHVDRLLPAARWPRAIVLSLAAVVLSSIVGLLAYVATGPLESRIGTKLLAWEREHNAATRVLITYQPSRERQAQALEATFSDWGFRVSTERRDDAGVHFAQNELTESPSVDGYTIRWLAQRIEYLSYGLDVRLRPYDWRDGTYLEIAAAQADAYQNCLSSNVRQDAGDRRQKLEQCWVTHNVGQHIGGRSPLIVTLADGLPEGSSFREGQANARDGVPVIFEERLAKGGLGPQMVVVPSGSASGAADSVKYDRPVRRSASLSKPLAFGRYEVTVGEFRRFVAATGYETVAETSNLGCNVPVVLNARDNAPIPAPTMRPSRGVSWRSPTFAQTDADPVVCVGWSDANAYAQWLSDQTGARYRLPTNDEWTYAWLPLKANVTSSSADACAFANLAGNVAFVKGGCNDRFVNTAPVGSFRTPSEFELADMFGNVLELATCEDRRRRTNVAAQQTPSDGTACDAGVIRGSGWADLGLMSSRDGTNFNVDEGAHDVGFRVVRDLDSWLVTEQQAAPAEAVSPAATPVPRS
jgi:formylglycine-generating enzyme required for sulfatase activity